MIRTSHLALARELLLQLRHRHWRTYGQVVVGVFTQTRILQTSLPEVQPLIVLKLDGHHP
ncbi:hypothetical protein D3C80_1967810 [compost metagenome]